MSGGGDEVEQATPASARSDRAARAERRALARRRSETGLAEGAAAGAGTARAAAELERRIAAIWEDVLRPHKPGVHDNFFEVGGTSLLLIEVHRRLQETVGRVAMVELFQHPTVASLAGHLAAASGAQAPPGPATPRPPGAMAAPQASGSLARQRAFMQQRRSLRRRGDGEHHSP
jgi:hypothetical protein